MWFPLLAGFSPFSACLSLSISAVGVMVQTPLHLSGRSRGWEGGVEFSKGESNHRAQFLSPPSPPAPTQGSSATRLQQPQQCNWALIVGRGMVFILYVYYF